MSFLSLNEIIFIPPISTIITVLIVISIIFCGRKLGEYIYGCKNIFSNISGYILIILILSIIANSLISYGINGYLIIRLIISSIIIYGLYKIKNTKKQIHKILSKLIRTYSALKTFEKVIAIILIINIINLFLCSLSPPTDADSLDYHLGVPLLWIQNLNQFPLDGWLHTRLIGLGEAINYIGLVCGTDILGQVIQYSGLWIVFLSFFHLSNNKKHILLFGLLIFCIPLNLSLIASQKPFVFPSAVIFYGFILFIKENNYRDKKLFYIPLIFVCYGIACKYSFIIPGAISIFYIGLIAFKKNILPKFILALIVAASITIIPIYIRNLLFYGDPISPMLEFIKLNPVPLVVRFADSIKSYGGEINLFNIAILPIKLGITLNPSLLSTVLGFGIFSIIFVKIKTHEARVMCWSGLIISLFILAVGNISPRYYLNAYWLFIGAISINELSKKIYFFRKFIYLQAIIITFVSFYGAVSLFPGALSSKLRDNVMSKSANGYNESKWIDDVLPEDALIIAQVRSNALLPRKYIPWDQFFWGDKQVDLNKYLNLNKDKINALLLKSPLHQDLSWLKKDDIKSFKKTFFKGTRNPFNRGNPYEMELFFLNADQPK